jgi:hypothetical protein
VHQVFVELYNYRPEWRSLDAEQRGAFVTELLAALTGLQERGVWPPFPLPGGHHRPAAYPWRADAGLVSTIISGS